MKTPLFASVLLSGTILYSSPLYAACTPAPDCASLGYTKDVSQCAGAALKCPWDMTKAACKEKAQEASLSVLYGDGTVSKEIITGKTPIGIVFDTDNRLAVALTDVKKDGTAGSEQMQWSSIKCDIPGLQNCKYPDIRDGLNLTPITCGVDGRLNTNAILANTCSGTTYAATAANNYQPAGCAKDFCKRSKWFIPSMRNFQDMYLQKTHIENLLVRLNVLEVNALGVKVYWSSTESGKDVEWTTRMEEGTGHSYDKRSSAYLRPVLAY